MVGYRGKQSHQPVDAHRRIQEERATPDAKSSAQATRAAERQRALGNQRLAAALLPRLAGALPPVQQKSDPGTETARAEQARPTNPWTNTALRPDCYPPSVQRKRSDTEATQVSTQSSGSGGRTMPGDVQAKMEHAFGADFSAIRIHEGPQAPAMGALAYTQGTDIHFAPGKYQPGSQSGQALLGHELAHAVQQQQGRVSATTQFKEVGVNDDAGLEREADEMGARAARGQSAYGPTDTRLSARVVAGGDARPADQGIVQGKWFRMSTILDDSDASEVAYINQLAAKEDFFGAFEVIVKKYPELWQEYSLIMRYSENADIGDAAYNILWETFEDPGKAYTAAEIMDIMWENEIIAEGIEESQAREAFEMEAPIQDSEAMLISVSFRSEIDKRQEEHRISIGEQGIMVASNPKPLKAVIASKTWEGHGLTDIQVDTLTGLRKIAKLALYKIAGNAKRNLRGARTRKNMKDFRMSLVAIANVFAELGDSAHATTLMPETKLSDSSNYGDDSPPTEGTHVIASPLSIKSAQPGSPPHDGRLMESIRKLAGHESKSYVQMHLLNDLVFGPGELWNLTPGTKQSNVDMESQVEDHLKRAVLGKGLVIKFEAIVKYVNNPIDASDKQIRQNPDEYRFEHIAFKAEQLKYNKDNKKWETASAPDPDVKAINGKQIKWRRGSLPPLQLKPRLFDEETTVKDLEAAGIQPEAARRILAFIRANPGWQPSGPQKKQQLAKVVKSYDKRRQIPNISSWKTDDVLWT